MARRPQIGSHVTGASCLAPVVALCVALLASAGQAAESAADVKAAFIFNFAKFVEWPDHVFAGADAPFVLCATDAEALNGRLGLLAGREVQGRRIAVAALNAGSLSAQGCHLLFVAGGEPASWEPVLALLGNAPVLTIGDAPSFADLGGMIELRVTGRRLRFDVDLGAVQAAGLHMGARVLQLANDVRRGP